MGGTQTNPGVRDSPFSRFRLRKPRREVSLFQLQQKFRVYQYTGKQEEEKQVLKSIGSKIEWDKKCEICPSSLSSLIQLKNVQIFFQRILLYKNCQCATCISF